MYNIYQLKQYANKFLKDTYGMELIVPLTLNGRMKTTCGWFKHRKFRDGRKGEPLCIELNKFFVENNDSEIVLSVLKHELIHYVLYMQGKPHTDGHPVFENELRKQNAVSQSTISKYTIESKPTKLHYYRCEESSCNKEYRVGRALKHNGRYHRCNCGGRLIDLGKKVVAS